MIISIAFLSLCGQSTLIAFLITSFATQLCFEKTPKLGIAINVAALIGLKVFEFIDESNNLLPIIGLSFYVLQNISLLVQKQQGLLSEYKQRDLLLWQSFFPKMFAGPILSTDSLSMEIGKTNWEKGAYRIVLGLFKKLVIADRLGVITSSVLDHYESYPGLTVYVGIIAFFVQLYFDFSGFVDIAIGSGELLGVRMPENFNLPLRAKTVSEFWRRWHMTLMNWLLNHIYYPLAYKMRKSKNLGFVLPIILVFLASGIWSGIDLKYIVCVLIFAGAIILERLLGVEKKSGFISWFWALISFHILAIGFSFFKWTNLGSGMEAFNGMFDSFLPLDWMKGFVAPIGDGASLNEQYNLIITLIITVITLFIEKIINSENKMVLKLSVLVMLVLFLANWTDTSRFIYMQFR